MSIFYIIEVKDHNDNIIKTATVTVDPQNQGHTLFCRTFHISAVLMISERSRCLFLCYEGQKSQR